MLQVCTPENALQRPRDSQENKEDEFSFCMLPYRHTPALVQRRLLGQQLIDELHIERVSAPVVGEQMRQVRPESGTFQALAQIICLDVALADYLNDKPTTRRTVARLAQELSGFDFTPFTESPIFRCEDGSTAINIVNLRCKPFEDPSLMIRQSAMAEAFTETRLLASHHKISAPADYSKIRDYYAMPEPDITYFQNVLVS